MSRESPPLPEESPSEEAEAERAPFGFKLVLALAVLYLGWRLAQGIMWVIRQLA